MLPKCSLALTCRVFLHPLKGYHGPLIARMADAGETGNGVTSPLYIAYVVKIRNTLTTNYLDDQTTDIMDGLPATTLLSAEKLNENDTVQLHTGWRLYLRQLVPGNAEKREDIEGRKEPIEERGGL